MSESVVISTADGGSTGSIQFLTGTSSGEGHAGIVSLHTGAAISGGDISIRAGTRNSNDPFAVVEVVGAYNAETGTGGNIRVGSGGSATAGSGNTEISTANVSSSTSGTRKSHRSKR